MYIIYISVVPVLLTLFVGYLLRRTAFVPDSLWTGCDKLIYFLFFPCLLIHKIATVDFSSIDVGSILIYIILLLVVASLVSTFIFKMSRFSGMQAGDVYQGSVRFNSYVFFAIIAELWGSEALALAAVVAGVFIPLVNICCITSYGLVSGEKNLPRMIFSVLKNPFVIAAAIGFILNRLPVLYPEVLDRTLVILAYPTLTLALLSVGASTRVRALFSDEMSYSIRDLLWVSVARLVFVPILACILFLFFDFDAVTMQVLLLLAAVSTATSSHVLSRQMGGDPDLMITIVSLQNLLLLVTLFLWLKVLLLF